MNESAIFWPFRSSKEETAFLWVMELGSREFESSDCVVSLSWLRGIFARPDSKLSRKKHRLKTKLVVQSGAKPE